MKIRSLRLGGVLRTLACAGVLVFGLTATPAMAKDVIVLCTIDDLSGDFSIMSTPKTYGYQLAVKEINDPLQIARAIEQQLLDAVTRDHASTNRKRGLTR